MTDTSPEIEALVRKRIMARSAEERFLMGIASFEAAREIVIASMPKDLPVEEFRRQLYQRFYGEPAPF